MLWSRVRLRRAVTIIHGDPRQVQLREGRRDLPKAIFEPSAIIINTQVDKRLRRFKVSNRVSPRRLKLFAQICHLSLELVLLMGDLRQLLLNFLQLLVEDTDGFLVLSLLIQQVRVMFTNSSDDPLLCHTTVAKGLDVHQGLKEYIHQSKCIPKQNKTCSTKNIINIP